MPHTNARAATEPRVRTTSAREEHRGPLWQPLDGGGAEPALVGGKAASLDALVAAGAPVPKAAALTIEAYRCFVEEAGLAPLLDGLGDDRGGVDQDARLEAAFLVAPLPAWVADAIGSAIEHVAAGGTVAVRSSAVGEDSATASFAGQYRSLLNVRHDEVERAVRFCWASLWASPARAYRLAKGLVGPDVAMGVVVQAMVAADRSGVAFTVDPTVAGSELIRVEVVSGLGEGLVSGELTPDVFHLRRDGLSVLQAHAPGFVVPLGRLALEIERRQGCPQDVEWSLEGDRLYVLQARPITAGHPPSGDGFDTAPIPGAQFTPAGIAEMLPGVLPPLLWTSNAPMLEEAFASLFRRLRISLPGPTQPMVGRFRGRAALNLSRLKAAASQMPSGAGAEVERQYLGRVVTTDMVEPPRTVGRRLRRLRSAALALRLRRTLALDAEVFLETVNLALGLQPDLARVRTAALVAYRRRLRELAQRGLAIEVAVAASAAANYRGLEVVLERWLGPTEAPLAAQRLTTGSVQGQAGGGCEVLSMLWDLHCEHCQLPDVARALREGDVAGTEKRLRAIGEEGAAFLGVVEEGLRRSGSAAVYGGPTWEEDRESLWALLRRCHSVDVEEGRAALTARFDSGADQFLKDLELQLTHNWRWRATRVLTGQIVDVRRRLLRQMVADTGAYLSMREAVKAAFLRLGGEERRVVRELTRRLLNRGELASQGDEWLLSDEELDRIALGGRGPGAEALERRRNAWEQARRSSPLPEVFSGPPGPGMTPRFEAGDLLSGWAASSGRATGRAFVVANLTDARSAARDDILVGHSTDPSWTPVLLSVAGIVMEQGGPLSHAAILAREFGVPAVLNARGATRRIRTGMRITVDGTSGTVEIHGEGLGAAA